jgi:hypothetical protein
MFKPKSETPFEKGDLRKFNIKFPFIIMGLI